MITDQIEADILFAWNRGIGPARQMFNLKLEYEIPIKVAQNEPHNTFPAALWMSGNVKRLANEYSAYSLLWQKIVSCYI